jgi:hypothetical protein
MLDALARMRRRDFVPPYTLFRVKFLNQFCKDFQDQ